MRGLVLSFLLLSVTAHAQNWTEVYKSSKASVPLILMSGGYCSGSLIEKDLVLTAAHCVSMLRPVSVSWSDDLTAYESTKVVAMDRGSDLALLRLSKPNIRTPLKIAAEANDPYPGDPVATIGHPATRDTGWNAEYFFKKDEIYLISSGIVSGIGEQDLITDASLTPGNSGGPILNPKSEIVGVASRKRIGSTVGSIGFAPHAKSIRGILEKNKKDGDREPKWYQAATDMNLSLSYATYRFSRNNQEEKAVGLFGVRVGFDFWDRLRLEYSENFAKDYIFSDISLGWKFQILEPSQHIWNVVPFVSYASSTIDDDSSMTTYKSTGVSGGVEVATSRFPFSFRLTGVRFPDEDRAVLQLHLPFF